MLRPAIVSAVWLLLVVVLAARGRSCRGKGTRQDTEIIIDNSEVWDEKNPCGLSSYSDKKFAARIKGGKRVRPGELPWLVRLGNWCSGVIIDEQHILASGGCSRSEEEIPVYIGCHKVTDEDCIKMNVTKWKNFDNSLGGLLLMRTPEPMKFELTPNGRGSVNRICMPSKNLGSIKPELDFVAAGWGAQPDAEPRMTEKLLVMNPGACKVLIEDDIDPGFFPDAPTTMDTKREMCALDWSGQEELENGDFGGPLMFQPINKYELHGIAVYGHLYRFDIFSKVEYYLDWIEATKKELAN